MSNAPRKTTRLPSSRRPSPRPARGQPARLDTARPDDQSQEGFAILDGNWQVLQMNAAGLRCGRRTAAEAIGRNHWAVWPETVGTDLEATYRRVMATGQAESFRQAVVLGEGAPSIFEISAQRRPNGFLAVLFRDVTLIENTHLALRRSQARAEAALAIARLGSFVWHRDDGRVDCSARVREIFGFEDGQGQDWAEFAQRIVADDLGRVRAQVDDCLALRGELRVRYRILHSDGSVRHVQCHAAVEEAGGRWTQLAGIFQDVTQDALAAQGLREIDNRKDEFLALLAHELRNPLAPIVTAAQILRRPGLSGDRVRGIGEMIQRQAGHLTALLSDLLDVSRINKGVVLLTRSVLDLHKVLDDALEQTRPLMERRSQRFTHSAPPQRLPVDGDENRLVQIFANILNNSAKYTPSGGEIFLTVAADSGRVTVKVRDSGIGMAPELLPHVFEAFTQAERSSDRMLGGLGLGLALVKNLVELHGGQVQAHSTGLGHGSEITVTLPLAHALPAADRRAGAPREPASLRPLSVVVVDDNVDGGFTLATLLEMAGHQVTVRQAAESALTSEGFADVYILDIGLPGMDGHELAREIRAAAPAPGPLLIALTGHGSAQDRERSLAAGFDHHFEKPLDPSRLLDLIGKARRSASGPG